MNLCKKVAAVVLSAAMLISGMTFSAFADTATGGTDGGSASTGGPPALGGGASNVSVKSYSSNIKKGDTISIDVVTYIPIVNFVTGTKYNEFPLSSIYATAQLNESFNPTSASASGYRFWLSGAFLCVESTFSNVVYLGKGNTFSYFISYTGENNGAMSAALSGSLAGCSDDSGEKPEEVKPEVPAFALKNTKAYTLNAGESTKLRFEFRALGIGKITQVNAILSSSDPGIIIDDMGEKSCASISPYFDFPVTVPKTTPAGLYTLTLKMRVFDENYKEASTADYSIPVNVLSDIKNNGLSIEDYKVSKEPVSPGDEFTLSLRIKNNCGIDLKEVAVSLGIDNPNKFVLDGGFSKQSVDIKNGKTASVSFKLVAGEEIKSVRESIGVKASYRINPSKAETEQSFDTSVIIECKPADTGANNNKYALSMVDYTVSKTDIENGTAFTLAVTMRNSDSKNIENARVTLNGLDGGKFAVDSGLTYVDFDIAAGQTKTFTFNLVGCSGISSIREVVPIHIEFGDNASDVYATISCKPDKSAGGNSDGETFAPNIIIESYDFGGTFVTAGQTFPLSVKLKNTSGSAVIENLKVTVNGASNSTDGSIAYSPANSSNSFFFETLGVKSYADVSLDLLAKSDANPNSYPINISFDYEYSSNGKHYKANSHSETITIPLQQEDRLSITDPEAPAYVINIGDRCSINISIVNKGKSSAYNVSATVEGEGFQTENPTYYIGNIESGKEEYYDTMLSPLVEGEISGEIVFTYEDANGAQKEQRKPFKFTAAAFNYGGDMYGGGMIFDDGMMPAEEENSGSMLWLWFVIGGAVLVIVGIIITVVLVKKSKARKLQRELEADDEDN